MVASKIREYYAVDPDRKFLGDMGASIAYVIDEKHDECRIYTVQGMRVTVSLVDLRKWRTFDWRNIETEACTLWLGAPNHSSCISVYPSMKIVDLGSRDNSESIVMKFDELNTIVAHIK